MCPEYHEEVITPCRKGHFQLNLFDSYTPNYYSFGSGWNSFKGIEIDSTEYQSKTQIFSAGRWLGTIQDQKIDLSNIHQFKDLTQFDFNLRSKSVNAPFSLVAAGLSLSKWNFCRIKCPMSNEGYGIQMLPLPKPNAT